MSDAAVTIIGVVVAGILGGVSLFWSGRKLRKSGVGAPQAEAIANLQLLADTWEERYDLEHEARMKAEKAVTDVSAERDALSRLLERRRTSRDPRAGA